MVLHSFDWILYVIQLSDRVYNVTFPAYNIYSLRLRLREYRSWYYGFSLLHIFSLVLQPWMSAYITDLVCYTYVHWFFNPECQHIFGKQTGYIFQSPKRLKHGRQNITLHWINGIIRNNKCIFTKLNAVFILETAAWTKKYYNG